MASNLINYQLATKGFQPRLNGGLYTYIMAANGVFVYSKNNYIEATIPVGYVSESVRGLEPLQPSFSLIQKVNRWNVAQIEDLAHRNLPNEVLFYLNLSPHLWWIQIPIQETSPISVKVTEKDFPYYPIEIHSHNTMDAFFSAQDDKDETGLRIYAVLGKVDQKVMQIRTRVGIYGHMMQIPAKYVFECDFLQDTVDWDPITGEAIDVE